MDKRKRIFVVLTIIFTLASVGLIVAAFATDNWIKGDAELKNITITNRTNTNNIPYAHIRFGIFRGERTIDYGFSPRPQIISGIALLLYTLGMVQQIKRNSNL